MTEPIYKIGDVLSYSDTASTYLILAVKDAYLLRGTGYQYKCLKTRGCYCDEAQIIWVSEFFFVKACNRVGHIDISWLTGKPDAKPTSGRYKWEVTNEDLPEIIKSLEDMGMEVTTKVECDICKDEYYTPSLLDNLKHNCELLEEECKTLRRDLENCKKENEELKKDNNLLKVYNDIWQKGWNAALDSFSKYLNS